MITNNEHYDYLISSLFNDRYDKQYRGPTLEDAQKLPPVKEMELWPFDPTVEEVREEVSKQYPNLFKKNKNNADGMSSNPLDTITDDVTPEQKLKTAIDKLMGENAYGTAYKEYDEEVLEKEFDLKLASEKMKKLSEQDLDKKVEEKIEILEDDIAIGEMNNLTSNELKSVDFRNFMKEKYELLLYQDADAMFMNDYDIRSAFLKMWFLHKEQTKKKSLPTY